MGLEAKFRAPRTLNPKSHQVRFAVVEPLLEAVAGEEAVAELRWGAAVQKRRRGGEEEEERTVG